MSHALRALSYLLAVAAITFQISGAYGFFGGALGVVAALIVAGRLANSSAKTLVLVAGALIAAPIVPWIVQTLFLNSLVAGAIGPGVGMHATTVARWFAWCLGATLLGRTLAIRHPNTLVFEPIVLLIAYAAAFAAHRDGVIARPLWLSDWAWRHDVDPARMLLALGAAGLFVLVLVVIFERKQKLSLATAALLLIVAIVAATTLSTASLPHADAANDLGLTNKPSDGEQPRTPPPPDAGRRGREQFGDGGAPRRPELRDGGVGGGGDGSIRVDAGVQREGNFDGGVDRGRGGREGNDAGRSQDGGTRDAGSAGGSNPDAGLDGGASSTDAGRDGGGGSSGTDAGRDGGGGGSGRDASQPPSNGPSQDSPPRDGGASSGQSTDAGTPPDGATTPPPPPPRRQDNPEDESVGAKSPAPMAIVVFEDDYAPPAKGYYFRQQAWSQYNGIRLEAAPLPLDADMLRTFPTSSTTVTAPPPSLGRTPVRARVSLLVDHTAPFALESGVTFKPTRNPNPDRFVRSFEFASLAQSIEYEKLFNRKAGSPSWSPETRAHYLQGPTDPRYRAMADAIVAKMPEKLRNDPFAQALSIKLELDKTLTYSTRHRHKGVDDPTADFLFGDKTGYCVHFAHATVFLWRSLGIPSRVGTGYYVQEAAKGSGSSLLLRGGDSHAWPELYIDGVGWIILDISPEKNLDPPGQPMDQDLQRELGEMARGEDAEPPVKDENKWQWKTWQRDLAYAGLGLLLFAWFSLYAIKGWRRVAPRVGPKSQRARLGYRATLDRLAEAGLVRDFGETPEAFATRIAGTAPGLTKLTELHLSARFRGAPPASSDVHAAMDQIKIELRQNTKLTQRLLGLLNPFSFFRVR